jgi:hypothetical protein
VAEQNRFWAVWPSCAANGLSARYPTEAEAFDEAERLAELHPDVQFFVFVTTASFWRETGTDVFMLVWGPRSNTYSTSPENFSEVRLP